MKRSNRSVLVALSLMSVAGVAGAQPVRPERTISLALANEAALAAVADCAAKGYFVTAAVVDRAGKLKALARGDNSGPHTVDSSRRGGIGVGGAPGGHLDDQCSQAGIDKIKDRLN